MNSFTRSARQLFEFVRTHSRRLGWIAVSAGFMFQAALLTHHMGAYAGASDSSGYMNMARLLTQGQTAIERRVIDHDPAGAPLLDPGDYTFVPLGFRPTNEGKMTPTYPLGLPLFIAGTAAFTGWLAAPGVVLLVHALLALVLFFLLGRSWGLPRGWCVFGTLLLAGCPLILMFSIQTMSDVPAMTWTLATIFLAWKSRERSSLALIAGLAFGLAVLVRPSNALIAFPLIPVVGLRGRQWLLMGLGGAPCALVFLGYNRLAYGDPFATGYGDISYLLSLKYVMPTLENYARWLPVLLTPLLILAPGVFWVRTLPVAARAAFPLWIVAFLGFYACYQPTHTVWWYLRFILPVFPALVLAFLLTGHCLAEHRHFRLFDARGSWGAISVSLLLIAGVVSNNRHWIKKLYPFASQQDERVYYDACHWAKSNLPADAVIASLQLSGALLFYTDFTIVRWDTWSPTAFDQVDAAINRSKRPFYILETTQFSERAMEECRHGTWQEIPFNRRIRVYKRNESPAAVPPSAP